MFTVKLSLNRKFQVFFERKRSTAFPVSRDNVFQGFEEASDACIIAASLLLGEKVPKDVQRREQARHKAAEVANTVNDIL